MLQSLALSIALSGQSIQHSKAHPMCGIAGILDYSDQFDHRDAVQRIVADLRHRGPDGEGVEQDGPCVLGHSRLAILDLSSNGAQPMAGGEAGNLITFNGEIYNFPQLRKELEQEGIVFRSMSDTEVIIKLYERIGINALDKLRGMFALGIWDSNKQGLLLARDPLGKKPLYYVQGGRRLAFASEIKPLAELPWVSKDLNTQALKDYWTFSINPGVRTFFAPIRRLCPGAWLWFDRAGLRAGRHWNLPEVEESPHESFAQACERFVELLEVAIKRRLLSDVPLGAFLSGGLDSSTIVALMSRHVSRVRTFTVSFPDKHHDEAPLARRFADQYGTDHTEIPFEATRYDPEILDLVLDHCGEPFGDLSCVPTYLITRAMKGHITVALSGDGGDELLAGYRSYGWVDRVDRLSKVPEWILAPIETTLNLFRRLPGSRRLGVFRQLARAAAAAQLPLASRIKHVMRYCVEQELAELFSPRVTFDGEELGDGSDYLLSLTPTTNALVANVQFDLRQKLPEHMLVKVDRMSMANSFEVRSPFLDRDLVDYVGRLPISYKYRNGETKRLLRHSMRGLLSAELLGKPKAGFDFALSSWKTPQMLEQGRELMSAERIVQQGLFNPRAVDRIRDDFESADRVPPGRLSRYQVETRYWLMLVFQRWHQLHFR